MWFGRNKVRKALERVAKGEASYLEGLRDLRAPEGLKDAEALAEAMRRFRTDRDAEGFYSLLGLFQDVDDKPTAVAVSELAIPPLLALIDKELSANTLEGGDWAFAAKVLALYPTEETFPRMVAIVEAFPDEYLWSVVFSIFADGHRFAYRLLERFAERLPTGFARVAYLDLANQLAIAGKLEKHPFDTDAGLELLLGWLTSRDETEDSYAHSATAAIPFLAPARRTTLLNAATSHRSVDVRMEAAWAVAKLGDSPGLGKLAEMCLDVRTFPRAHAYLAELLREDLVPAECSSDEFQAKATMCEWLLDPSEFGRAPEEIEHVGTFTLQWPPTGDRRRLDVIKYQYAPKAEDAEPEVGHGLVGSITFSLVGETGRLSPLEVVALHCAWELEVNDQLVRERSVQVGLELLRAANPELERDLPN